MDKSIRRCPRCRAVNFGRQKRCLRCSADLTAAECIIPPPRVEPAGVLPQAPGPARPPVSVPSKPSPQGPSLQTACPRCGKTPLPGQRFCAGCGARLQEPKLADLPLQVVCPRCGRISRPGELYCSNCGTALRVAPPAGLPPSAGVEPPASGAAPPPFNPGSVSPAGKPSDIPLHTLPQLQPSPARPVPDPVVARPPAPAVQADASSDSRSRPSRRRHRWLWLLGGLVSLALVAAALAYFGLFVFNPFNMLASTPRNTAAPAPTIGAPASPGLPQGVLYGFYQGDGREGSDTLWIASANTDYAAPPQNVTIGTCGVTTRVNELITMDRPGQCIWADVATAETSVGVQFWGSSVKSEVRVLVDDQVYWTGSTAGPNADTTAVPFEKFFVAWQLPSAPHSIKVEYLSGPTVTVRYFGFNYQ